MLFECETLKRNFVHEYQLSEVQEISFQETISILKAKAKANIAEKRRQDEMIARMKKIREQRQQEIFEAAKAKVEAEKKKENCFLKFQRNIENEILKRKYYFEIMAEQEIPMEIIEKYLDKKWDILALYLDDSKSDFPWKYCFTKVVNGEKGIFRIAKYTNVYED